MSEFSINDKRHSNPQRLITSNLSSELDAAKKGLPLNHTAEEDKRAMRASRFRKQAETSGSSGGMQIAYPKTREPFGTWEDKGIPHNMADEEDRMKLRSWCRAYFATHNLVSTAVDVYSRFPVQGMELASKSDDLTEFYTQLFMNEEQLDYENFVVDLGKEYHVTGEVTSFANFNDELGVWDAEEIINPDSIEARKNPFTREIDLKLGVPEYLQEIIRTCEPRNEYMMIAEQYPELIQAVLENKRMSVSNVLIARTINKVSAWDVYGTPHMMRAFRPLLQEESLNAAQDAVCVLAGTPILTDQGVTYIENIQKGDSVLTHLGRYRTVLRTMVREADEPGVTLRWYYDKPLTMTGEHPVLVRRNLVQPGVCSVCRVDVVGRRTICEDHSASSIHTSPVGQRRFKRGVCCICGDAGMTPKSVHCSSHNPQDPEVWEGWVPSREVSKYDMVWHPSQPRTGKESVSVWEHLSQDDWVAYDPSDEAMGLAHHAWYTEAATQTRRVTRNRLRQVVSDTRDIQEGDILRPARLGSVAKHFSSEYKLTEDLMWLIGLHVADGSALDKSVTITLGTHEVGLQERAARVILEVFGIEAKIAPVWGGALATNVSVHSLPLAHWFRAMCGVRGTKRFPSWAFGLSEPLTAAMIGGWMDGDGHRAHDHSRGTTAYRHLQEQVARLIRSLGFASTVHGAESKWPGIKGGGNTGVIGSHTDAYSEMIGVHGIPSDIQQDEDVRRSYTPTGDFADGYWSEVRGVTHHQITDTVYNLDVEEDNSYCAPIAVHNCDRLYAPFVLAKMGLQDIGDGEPWIPTPDELDAFTSQIQLALAADFRMLVHHLGVDIKSVFGRETVPNFSADYDRLERKILQVWGIGESLLSGSTSGTYASAALNRDLVTQLMSDWQKKVQRHYRKRALIVAEAQGHFDYEVRGGIHYPIYDEFIQVDPENGKEYIVKKPRLLIPDINFASINMNDEDKERSFLQQLANAGVPISNQALMVNIPFDFEDELERKAEEEIKKTISRAETKKRALEVMQARGLLKYADPDLQQLAANPEEMVSPDAVPLQNLDQSSDGTDTGDGTNSTKPDAVNLNKDHSFEEINNMGVPEQERTELSDQTSPRAESAPKTLPRNEVGQRPEVSDEKRKDSPMPRSATRFVEDPWHVGKSALLSEESVQELIQNRPWRRSLGKED